MVKKSRISEPMDPKLVSLLEGRISGLVKMLDLFHLSARVLLIESVIKGPS